MTLKDKKIVLGVTGAISAYKALEIARLLVKEGAAVWPVMTEAAAEFITPLSLATLCSEEVRTSLFDPGRSIDHIRLGQEPDLILAAPATANLIGHVASGIADDLLTTLIMAASAPVLIAPSMNTRMWENKIVQANVKRLSSLGYLFTGPASGELACGYEGMGRLADPADIIDAVEGALSVKDLAGESFLVTSGPTREAIDPVRYVSNRSSGAMGFAIARAALLRGAKVVLVTGPSCLKSPAGVVRVDVTSAAEMASACAKHYPKSTIAVMAAAVADYAPAKASRTKLKKGARKISIELTQTTDILKQMGARKGRRFLVGFALETERVEANAWEKLKAKKLDMVVANTPAGIGADVNEVTIMGSDGLKVAPGPISKESLADEILDNVVRLKRPVRKRKPR